MKTKKNRNFGKFVLCVVLGICFVFCTPTIVNLISLKVGSETNIVHAADSLTPKERADYNSYISKTFPTDITNCTFSDYANYISIYGAYTTELSTGIVGLLATAGSKMTQSEYDALVAKRDEALFAINSIDARIASLNVALEQFYRESKIFIYESVIESDEQSLIMLKEANEQFYNDEVVLSFVNTLTFTYDDGSGAKQVMGNDALTEAKNTVDRCLNKLIAIREFDEKKAYFENKLSLLPNIVDVKNSDEEELKDVKAELQVYIETYAIHLSEDDRKVFDDIMWQIDKRLEQLSPANNPYVFWVFLIVFLVAGLIYMFYKGYFDFRKKPKNPSQNI